MWTKLINDHNKPQLSNHRFWRWLIGICGVFTLLGAVYMVVTPPLESSDEYKHYPVVHYVENMGKMVVLDPHDPQKWAQDGAQPPLYYIVMALLTAPLDTTNLDDIHIFNDHAFTGDPNQIHNKNLIIPTPEQRDFPGNGAVKAIYLIRTASILLSVGTVICAGLLGRAVFNPKVGLFAAALTAFNPMFLFTSAAVNNDSLANLLGALGLLLLVRLWQRYDGDRPLSKAALLTLGIVLGLGILTKLSLGALLGLTGCAMALLAYRKRRWQTLFVDGIIVATAAFALSAPLFWFNWTQYGNITALNVFIEVQGKRTAPLRWDTFWGEFGTFYRSLWGLFGGVNIAPPRFFYWLWNSLALIAAVRLVFTWKTRETAVGRWLLIAWPTVLFALLLNWVWTYYSFQGRLIFPGLTAISVLMAAGLWFGRKTTLILGTTLAAVALAVALFVIRPVYTLPTPLFESPDTAFTPIPFTDGTGTIELVGVEMDEQHITAGSNIPINVTLYWRAAESMTTDYLSTIHLLGRDLVSVSQINRIPAYGMVPTSQWEMGQVWQDEYRLFVKDDMVAPNQLLVDVDLYDPEQKVSLNEGLTIVGRATLHGTIEPDPRITLNQSFADHITLVGYDMVDSVSAGQTFPITLTWTATDTPTREYTVFVQLLDEDRLIANGDSPPIRTVKVADNFPTSLWRDGDVIVGRHEMVIPADVPHGTYRIAIGLYDGDYRLPLTAGGDAVVWTINVTP